VKIFWWSNAPWVGSGYGAQTNLFWWRLQKLGHEVTLGASYGLNGSPLNLEEHGEKTRVFPLGYTQHGNDIIGSHALHVGADIVITLYDSWVYNPQVTSKFRWCPWAPIDHTPMPPGVRTSLQAAWQPIAYSQHGFDQMTKGGLDPRYVPHGIDTTVFDVKDRDEARAALNLPGKDYEFMAVMVAANKGIPSRKAFPEILWAWKQFIDRHPNSLLYLHTHSGAETSGADLMQILNALDIPEGTVLFADPYWLAIGHPPAHLAQLYNAADVLLSPSYGEGFGVPIIEAQGCGTPVIVNDCTSMPQLCFSGWVTTNQPIWSPQNSWQFKPDQESILECLEQAYQNRGSETLRRGARDGAMQYDADLVTEKYWKPVLDEIESELGNDEGDGLVDLAE